MVLVTVSALLAAAAAGGCGTTPSGRIAPAPSVTTSPATGPSTATSPPPSNPPPPSQPPPSTGPTAGSLPDHLRSGSRGPDVLALQRRLTELGYWLGEPDGVYGASTAHAVTAFQKVAGLGRDGVAGPATRQALQSAGRPTARSGTGRMIEVDLDRQVLLVVAGGHVTWVFDASTGSRPGTTPTGHFKVYRQVNGYDHAPLGTLYRPKYFYRGVAVHGFPNVPPKPASHGCVRMTNAAMDWLWSSDTLPIGQPVWVY